VFLTRNRHDVPDDHRSPGRRVVRTAGIMLALAAGVTWLAVSAGPRSSSPADQPTIAAANLTELHRLPPIYALYASASTESSQRIALAQQRLAIACMARLGFSYRPARLATSQELAADDPAPFGLESINLADAGGAGETPTEDPAGKDERYGRALFGDPKKGVTARGARLSVARPATGCLADAERRLLGDQRVRWIQLHILLFEAEQDARELLNRDPEFRAVNSRWQDCMRRAGIQAPDPQQLARARPAGIDLHTDPASLADVRCKAETRYLATGYGRLAAMQRQRLDADRSVLRDWQSLLRRQDLVAHEVLKVG
jgi:hypothetical protein